MKATEFRKIARENLRGKWFKAVLIFLAYSLVTWILGFVMGIFEDMPIVNLVLVILNLFISIPLSFSILVQYLNISNGKEVKTFDFVKWSFTNLKRSWKVAFSMLRKLLIPIVVIFIASIIPILLVLLDVNPYNEPPQYSSIPDLATSITYNDQSYLSTTNFSTNMTYFFFNLISRIGYTIGMIWFMVKSYYYALVPYIMEDNSELNAKEIVNKSEELMQNNRWNLFCLSFSFIGWAILSIFTLYIGLIFVFPYMQVAFAVFYKEKAGQLTENKPAEA